VLGHCLIRLNPYILPRSYHSPSEEEILITRMLDKILRRSDAIDRESLCVVGGQRVSSVLAFKPISRRRPSFLQVWHLRLTVHCLADAGNMLDCACLAGIVAFKHFRKPEVEVVGDEVTVVRMRISVAQDPR